MAKSISQYYTHTHISTLIDTDLCSVCTACVLVLKHTCQNTHTTAFETIHPCWLPKQSVATGNRIEWRTACMFVRRLCVYVCVDVFRLSFQGAEQDKSSLLWKNYFCTDALSGYAGSIVQTYKNVWVCVSQQAGHLWGLPALDSSFF